MLRPYNAKRRSKPSRSNSPSLSSKTWCAPPYAFPPAHSPDQRDLLSPKPLQRRLLPPQELRWRHDQRSASHGQGGETHSQRGGLAAHALARRGRLWYVCISLITLDALEKRYLRGLVFAIYDNPQHKDQSKLLETYSCTFSSLLFPRRLHLSRRRERDTRADTQRHRQKRSLHRRREESGGRSKRLLSHR